MALDLSSEYLQLSDECVKAINNIYSANDKIKFINDYGKPFPLVTFPAARNMQALGLQVMRSPARSSWAGFSVAAGMSKSRLLSNLMQPRKRLARLLGSISQRRK